MTDLLQRSTKRGAEDNRPLAELMEEFLNKGTPLGQTLQRGDVIPGVVVGIEKDALYVDVGLKSEGMVPAQEVHSLDPTFVSQLKPGDEVLVYVLQPESPDGPAILSLSRALSEQGWRILQRYLEAGETLEGEVVDFNRGGLIVSVEGIRGFVPASQIASLRYNGNLPPEGDQGLGQWVGQKLRLKVLEINRRRNRLVLSERAALQEWRTQQREKLLAELREGQVRRGRVTSIRSFGAFVDLGGADGLAHLSELSWDRVEDPHQILQVGEEVDVYVLSVDAESKRIALSLRRAQAAPWQEIAAKYQVGQLVTGTITKLVNFGAFARIEGAVEGLIHVSELSERRIVHPKEVVKEGDVLTLRIVRIEPERHRLALSLKQAQEEAEAPADEIAGDL